MKPTRNSQNIGFGFAAHGVAALPTPHRGWAAAEIGTKKKPTLAEKLRAYRAALRDEGREPVDDFCRRGETTARFAYFD